MRRFYLQRDEDISGISGTGKVGEGCEFDNGWCALVWMSSSPAFSYYPDINVLSLIHGHGGRTNVVWVDDESSNVKIERYKLKEQM